jgi:hypothetical protein
LQDFKDILQEFNCFLHDFSTLCTTSNVQFTT